MIHFLIDYENRNEYGLSGIRELSEEDHVYILFSQNACKLDLNVISDTASRIHAIKVQSGRQSLDMHLVSCLGFLINQYGTENTYYIISDDTDFDKVIEFWKARGYNVSRVKSIEIAMSPEAASAAAAAAEELVKKRHSAAKRTASTRRGRKTAAAVRSEAANDEENTGTVNDSKSESTDGAENTAPEDAAAGNGTKASASSVTENNKAENSAAGNDTKAPASVTDDPKGKASGGHGTAKAEAAQAEIIAGSSKDKTASTHRRNSKRSGKSAKSTSQELPVKASGLSEQDSVSGSEAGSGSSTGSETGSDSTSGSVSESAPDSNSNSGSVSEAEVKKAAASGSSEEMSGSPSLQNEKNTDGIADSSENEAGSDVQDETVKENSAGPAKRNKKKPADTKQRKAGTDNAKAEIKPAADTEESDNSPTQAEVKAGTSPKETKTGGASAKAGNRKVQAKEKKTGSGARNNEKTGSDAESEASDHEVSAGDISEETPADPRRASTAKSKAQPESVAINSHIQKFLSQNKVNGSVINSIASIVAGNAGKKDMKALIYRQIIKKFGQKKGLEYYKILKSEL